MSYRGEGVWTEEELHLLRSRYNTLGPTGIAKLLNRTINSVKAKARNEGIRVGDVQGWVTVATVADEARITVMTVRKRAQRLKVLRRLRAPNGRTIMCLVPEAWGGAYINAVERGREAETLEGHHYTLNKVARLFSVNESTIRRWLYGKYPNSYGARMMNRIKFTFTTGVTKRKYLFNPWDCEREAKAYREHKRTQENQ